jgi:hypothetical protein
MDIIAVWLIDFFFCRVVVCTVGLVMVEPSVYRARRVCTNVLVYTAAALCSSWLESEEPLRNVTSSYRIMLDDHSLFSSVCCLPNSPSYSENFEPRSSREQHP